VFKNVEIPSNCQGIFVSLSDRSYEHKNDGVLLLPIILKPFLGRPLLSAPIENHVLQQLLNYNNRKYTAKYIGLGKLIKPLYPSLLRVIRSGVYETSLELFS